MFPKIAHLVPSPVEPYSGRQSHELEGSQPVVELDCHESFPIPITNLGTTIALFEPTPTSTASEHPLTWSPLDIWTNYPLQSRVSSGRDEPFGSRFSGLCLDQIMEEDLPVYSGPRYSNVNSSLVSDTKKLGFPFFSPIGCPVCSKDFNGLFQKGNLTRHYRQTHALLSSIR